MAPSTTIPYPPPNYLDLEGEQLTCTWAHGTVTVAMPAFGLCLGLGRQADSDRLTVSVLGLGWTHLPAAGRAGRRQAGAGRRQARSLTSLLLLHHAPLPASQSQPLFSENGYVWQAGGRTYLWCVCLLMVSDSENLFLRTPCTPPACTILT